MRVPVLGEGSRHGKVRPKSLNAIVLAVEPKLFRATALDQYLGSGYAKRGRIDQFWKRVRTSGSMGAYPIHARSGPNLLLRPAVRNHFLVNGGPTGIRTLNQRIMSPLL